jgi:tRNA A37 threonylcarbamoyladenosine synthetase subunit TsaC/SUA5/YrdC
MPILRIDDDSVAQAVEVLRSGSPVVIPTPSPLAYTITGTQAAAVNTAKNRPASQPVGVSVADMDVIAPYLGLADGVGSPYLAGVWRIWCGFLQVWLSL